MTSEAVERHTLAPTDRFPNNPRLPVLVYRRAVQSEGDSLANELESRFDTHGWSGGWRDSVYDYAHYHSTAHEVLGCYAGNAKVELGGGELVVELNPGDVIVLPAGVAHRNVSSSFDFAVVGAYAQGRSYDMRRGAERSQDAIQIAKLPLPDQDPVYGREGPLLDAWKPRN